MTLFLYTFLTKRRFVNSPSWNKSIFLWSCTKLKKKNTKLITHISQVSGLDYRLHYSSKNTWFKLTDSRKKVKPIGELLDRFIRFLTVSWHQRIRSTYFVPINIYIHSLPTLINHEIILFYVELNHKISGEVKNLVDICQLRLD